MSYRVEKYEGEVPVNSWKLRREMELDGYIVYEWSDRPGTTYEMHAHGDDQSHCIVSGELELTVEGFGTVVLSPGDRDFMPARTRHSARVLGDEPVVYLIGSLG